MELNHFQRHLLLSVCPDGMQIKEAHYFQEEYLPCPVHVTVQYPSGSEQIFVLRLVRRDDQGLEKEAKLFPLLATLGLPTPTILVEPQPDPTLPNHPLTAVYSFLPGQTLQQMSELSATHCQQAVRLLITATSTLAAITSPLQTLLATPAFASLVPSVTLLEQWQMILAQGGPWLDEPYFFDSMVGLRPYLEQITEPLVFTNGDYQPANFLTDGSHIIGFLDFEFASFRDYLFGFVKYPIYDLHPLNKGGVIDHLLQTHQLRFTNFAPRLALGCLETLQREIAVTGGEPHYRTHVLGLLTHALRACRMSNVA